MPQYRCLNEQCSSFNEIKTDKSIIRVVNGNIVDSGIKCPICGLDREPVNTNEGFTTYMHGSANICRHQIMKEIKRLKVDFIDKETMCRFDELNRIMIMFDCIKSEIMAYYMDESKLVELEIKTKQIWQVR